MAKSPKQTTSAADHEDYEGQTLETGDHDAIRAWAELRGGKPATVAGTEHGDHLGVLRIDFPDYGGQDLREVSWEDWLATFDQRKLSFIYQEHKRDGSVSNFFRLESPEREDA